MRALVSLILYISSLIYPVPAQVESTTTAMTNFAFDFTALASSSVALGAPSSMMLVSLIDSRTEARMEPLYALPVDWDLVSDVVWARYHHDYPAIDVSVPAGTPVFAIREGIVTTATPSDGGACGGAVGIYTDIGTVLSCHLSQVVVKYNDTVRTGQLIGFSGGKMGSRGAGSATTPHVHVQITRNGRLICPQPLLVSIAHGEAPNLVLTTRCF